MTRARPRSNTKPSTEGPRHRRCAIYTRKSIARGLDKDFNSLVHQLQACESYIRARSHEGWELVPTEYSDGGFSGKDIERPGFQRLMADVEAGLVDVVVVYKVDRLSRSILDFAQVMRTFGEFNCAFVSVTQHFSTADAMGRLTLNILMSFAEFERDMISERTRDNIAAARRNGKWTGGPTPFGYRVDDLKKLVLDPDAAPLARHVFHRYEKMRSACLVARELDESSIQRPRMHGDTGGARPWDKNDILRILRNPVYTGLLRSDEGLVVGEHEALVDRERFERVQRLLGERRPRATPASRNPAYILRGLIRCGACGAAMTSASTTTKGTCYRYYRCTTRDKRGYGACPVRQVSAPRAEKAVVTELSRVATDRRLIDAIAGRVRPQLDENIARLEAERAAATADLARLSREEATATDPKARRVEQLVAAARSCDADQRLTRANAACGERSWATDVLGNFEQVWDGLTVENRARLVRALVERVTIDADSQAHIDLVNLDAAADAE
jgi:site-specific DNA recombinase